MSDEVVQQAQQKLAAFIEHFSPPALVKAYGFLASARGTEGGWGRVRGSKSEVRTTALALRVFAKDSTYLKFGEYEDGIQYLRNHLAIEDSASSIVPTEERTTIEEIALAADFLASTDPDRYATLLLNVFRQVIDRQNDDGGWGEGTSRVDTTATVLCALAKKGAKQIAGSAVKKGVTFLESAVNPDGGWGLARGASTALAPTSKALLGLCLSDRNNALAKKAADFLLTKQNALEGWWGQEDQSEIIYVTGLALRALAQAKITKHATELQKATRYLLEQQNKDGGWSWNIGEISEVEPTAVVLDSLLDAGITDYVSVSTSIEVLKGALEENVELRKQNQTLQGTVDEEVRKRIQNIVDTKDKLEQRVSQLEKDNKRLSRQQSELERLRIQMVKLEQIAQERLEVRKLLEQALNLVSGYARATPDAALSDLELLIASNEILTSGKPRTILVRLLHDLSQVEARQASDFSAYYKERLSELIPQSLATRIMSYAIDLTPVSSDMRVQIRALAERIEFGDLRVRSGMRDPFASYATAILLLSSDDRKLATWIAAEVSDILPNIRGKPDEPDKFIGYLGRGIVGDKSVPKETLERVFEEIRRLFRLTELSDKEFASRLRRVAIDLK